MAPWCLINKYSPTSAFQHLQIYNPFSDDFGSVFHILSDPSALIAFAVCSGAVVKWTHSHAQAPDELGWIGSARMAGSARRDDHGFAYGKTV